MRLLELSNGLHELAGIKHMPSIRLYRALTAIGASARTIGNSCCQSFSVHLHHACPIEELQHLQGAQKAATIMQQEAAQQLKVARQTIEVEHPTASLDHRP